MSDFFGPALMSGMLGQYASQLPPEQGAQLQAQAAGMFNPRANLTPERLAGINSPTNLSGWDGKFSSLASMALAPNAGGMHIDPTYTNGAGADGPGTLSGYLGVDPEHRNVGDSEYLYGADGSYGGTQQIQGDPWWAKPLDAATMAVLAGAGGYAAMGASGLIGGAAGEAAGAGAAGTTGAIATPVTQGIVNGVDLGALGEAGSAGGLSGMDLAADGALSGGNAVGAYGAAAGASGLAGAAAGGAGGIGGAAGGAGAAGAAGSGTLASLASSLGVSPGALLMGGGSLLSGLIGAGAASSAAKTQAGAAQNALGMQKDMFNTQVGLESPFRSAGVDATKALSYGLGLSTDGGPGASASGLGYGSMIRPFSTADFQEDPGIQFQTQQGNLALQNSQAAKNGVMSGAALKDLVAYNSGMAAQGYQSAYERYVQNQGNQFSRLSGVANTGQAAASNTANNAGNMANAMSNNITGIGNAQASGTVGMANALSSGIGGLSNYYLLSSLINKQQPMSATPAAGGNV